MEIQSSREDGILVLALTGRLDATWSDPVETAFDAAVRAGDHHIVMDLAGVDYISSAGLRVVIGAYKQLAAIQGGFSIRNAQSGVAKVIELSGLGALLATKSAGIIAPAPTHGFETANATWEAHGRAVPVGLRAVGGETSFDVSGGETVAFPVACFGLGVAALTGSREEALPRLGEFLAAGGCVVHLPANGENRPDFLLAEHAFVPSAWLSSGLVAEGSPGLQLRFEVRAESRGVPLAEIACAMLESSETDTAAFVMVVETAGLVGASLRESPAQAGSDPFGFPGVRDRLNFTSERAFRDTTCIAVGVVAKPGTVWETRLRPLAVDRAILGHVHAAVFPYRPIRKGAVTLDETVRGLFEAGGLQTVIHLLNDTREPEGSGDSEFHRGACWIAPISNSTFGQP